ncbi:MAG: hypothetical protein DRP06_03455 [Candidatus Aenigmatarchaeota archaeon]|nr:MAG: hypothetical protein DRP06_03455 [Candidatus Aenigmarchaeota archaeon]
MKEMKFVNDGILKQEIYDYLANKLKDINFEDIEVNYLPTNIRILIHTTQPGAIIGPGGEKISKLTEDIKKRFNIEAQVDIKRIDHDIVVPKTIASNIARGIENKKHYRRLADYHLNKIMRHDNVLGAEIVLDGLITGSKTRKDKFAKGYMKKSGSLVEKYVKCGIATAHPAIGSIGVKVSVYVKPK